MTDLILNDPGTLTAEAPNITLLPFATEKQDANFELGVSMIIHNWYTLTTAVDNLWGGPQSAEKRDWISAVVIDEFKNNKDIDIIYIHELLCGVMEDEFDTVIEDQSTIQIATKIIKCYKECKQNEFENVKTMYSKWLIKQQNRKDKIVANIVNDPLNPDISDDDDDDDDEEEDDDDDNDMDVDMNDITEQPRYQKNEPEIDDDGFTIVNSKRR
jgi:pre-rRNA-processing protein TSR2